MGAKIEYPPSRLALKPNGGGTLSKQIVVVGAGIAGLSAAYYIKQAGYQPVVLEKSSRVGGRMSTDVVNGYTIDVAAQFLIDTYPIISQLIERNELSSKINHTSPYLGIVRDGKIRKTLPSDLLSPLKAGILSLQGWLRFVLGSISLISQTKSLPINDITAWANYDDKDAEVWSNSFFGREVTDYMLEPLFDGAAYQALSGMSQAFMLPVQSMFLYRQPKKIISLKGGIAGLPERLASQLDVRVNTPVTSMMTADTGIELDTSTGRLVADGVIMATTASVAKTLYHSAGSLERTLMDTPYCSTVVIAIAMQESFQFDPEIEPIYAFMIPKVERNVISAFTNEASKDKLRQASGHLLNVFLSGKAGKEMVDWDEKAILPVVLKELDKYITGISEKIQFTRIYRWKEAMPLSPIGRCRNVAQYRQNINSSARVLLAGDYMNMCSTEAAAESGKWAAEALLKNLA